MITTEQTRKLISAIADCDRYIAKEGSRDPETRPAYAQKALDHAITHKAKLQRALETGSMDELIWHGGRDHFQPKDDPMTTQTRTQMTDKSKALKHAKVAMREALKVLEGDGKYSVMDARAILRRALEVVKAAER